VRAAGGSAELQGVWGALHPPRKAAEGKLRRTAGGSHFLGGELRKEEQPPVVTGTGAGCTSGACSLLVQNTAFPGRACSRKGGSGGGQGRQPGSSWGTAGPPGLELQGP
jgi:hypothetical protein